MFPGLVVDLQDGVMESLPEELAVAQEVPVLRAVEVEVEQVQAYTMGLPHCWWQAAEEAAAEEGCIAAEPRAEAEMSTETLLQVPVIHQV